MDQDGTGPTNLVEYDDMIERKLSHVLLTVEQRASVMEKVKDRMKMMRQPAHAAAFLLDPRRTEPRWLHDQDSALVQNTMRFLSRQVGGEWKGQAHLDIWSDLNEFHTKPTRNGPKRNDTKMWDPTAKADVDKKTPSEWWAAHGGDLPELQKVAIKRNKLSPESLAKLVYIHWNMQLLRVPETNNNGFVDLWYDFVEPAPDPEENDGSVSKGPEVEAEKTEEELVRERRLTKTPKGRVPKNLKDKDEELTDDSDLDDELWKGKCGLSEDSSGSEEDDDDDSYFELRPESSVTGTTYFARLDTDVEMLLETRVDEDEEAANRAKAMDDRETELVNKRMMEEEARRAAIPTRREIERGLKQATEHQQQINQALEVEEEGEEEEEEHQVEVGDYMEQEEEAKGMVQPQEGEEMKHQEEEEGTVQGGEEEEMQQEEEGEGLAQQKMQHDEVDTAREDEPHPTATAVYTRRPRPAEFPESEEKIPEFPTTREDVQHDNLWVSRVGRKRKEPSQDAPAQRKRPLAAPVVPPALGAPSAQALPPAVLGRTTVPAVSATRPPPVASDALASVVAGTGGEDTRRTTASLERQTVSPSERGSVFDELDTHQFIDGGTWGRNPGTSVGLHPLLTNAAAIASGPAGAPLAAHRETAAARTGMPFNFVKLERFRHGPEGHHPSWGPEGSMPKPPTYHMVRTTLLDELDADVQRCVKPVLETSRQSGCTIMTDGWTNIRGQTLCNYLVGTERGPAYLATDVMRGKKDVAALAKAWLHRLKTIDIQLNDITAFVTDSAGVNVSAMKIFQEDESVKHIFWIPCVTHVMDLILEDIGSIGWVASHIAQARLVTKFFKRHSHAREALEEKTKLKLLLPVETCFGTNVIMIRRLLELQAHLMQVVIEDPWRDTVWATRKVGQDAEITTCAGSPHATHEEMCVARERMRSVPRMGSERRLVQSDKKRRARIRARGGRGGHLGRGRGGREGRGQGSAAGICPRGAHSAGRDKAAVDLVRFPRQCWDEGDFLYLISSSDDEDFFYTTTPIAGNDNGRPCDNRCDDDDNDGGADDSRGPQSSRRAGGRGVVAQREAVGDGGGGNNLKCGAHPGGDNLGVAVKETGDNAAMDVEHHSAVGVDDGGSRGEHAGSRPPTFATRAEEEFYCRSRPPTFATRAEEEFYCRSRAAMPRGPPPHCSSTSRGGASCPCFRGLHQRRSRRGGTPVTWRRSTGDTSSLAETTTRHGGLPHMRDGRSSSQRSLADSLDGVSSDSGARHDASFVGLGGNLPAGAASHPLGGEGRHRGPESSAGHAEPANNIPAASLVDRRIDDGPTTRKHSASPALVLPLSSFYDRGRARAIDGAAAAWRSACAPTDVPLGTRCRAHRSRTRTLPAASRRILQDFVAECFSRSGRVRQPYLSRAPTTGQGHARHRLPPPAGAVNIP
ncbi:hypothetical protein CBR_g39935 [Chara braunii]|uniref:DUF659 domain-containing protein n=1 Tax=Chara braunii TaxID=69332 RepID=A0A388K1K6_CHABU|nr:hypothetical protein CBR_g39935 [Chara braunii]|eukprot:GBG63931.1 hypothetical protein CBR_g39935 [Chara braunii]